MKNYWNQSTVNSVFESEKFNYGVLDLKCRSLKILVMRFKKFLIKKKRGY